MLVRNSVGPETSISTVVRVERSIRGSRFAKRQALAFLRSRPPTTGIPNFYYLLLDDRGQARGFVEEAQPLRGQIYSVCSEAFPSASVERGTSVDDTKHSVRNKLTVSAVLRPRNLRPSDSRCTDVPWMRSLRLLNANPRGDRTRNARYRNASEAPGEDRSFFKGLIVFRGSGCARGNATLALKSCAASDARCHL